MTRYKISSHKAPERIRCFLMMFKKEISVFTRAFDDPYLTERVYTWYHQGRTLVKLIRELEELEKKGASLLGPES